MAEAGEDARLVRDNPIFSATDGNPSGARYPAAGAFATMPDLDRAPAAPAPTPPDPSVRAWPSAAAASAAPSMVLALGADARVLTGRRT